MASRKREVIDRLAAICAHAEALEVGCDVPPGVTGNALMQELSSLKGEIVAQAEQMVDELECLERDLAQRSPSSGNLLAQRSWDYLQRMEQWKAERPPMPGEIVGFILRKRIKRIRTLCKHIRERERYGELADQEAECDCLARARSGYLGRPHGNLRLVDSIGTPFLALCHTWTCTVCGAIWMQEEHHDRGTTHSKWSLGSTKHPY